VFGLLTAAKYVWDFDPLLKVLPFNMSRAIHLNLLVVWLLMGFMGGAYYLIPEETGRELWSPVLARVQFVFFILLAVGVVAGYLGRWFWGMPFLEQEKWLCIEAGLVLFTGIAGTGHHYYWFGTPHYWLWGGGIFSAFEPLPILFMVIDTLREVKERSIEIKNTLVVRYAVTGAFLHFVGAGVWGLAQTLPMINKWTHGTQITASHGHFAFFGAYAMINLTVMAFVLPRLRRVDMKRDRLGMPDFVLIVFFLVMIVLSLAIAGIVQVYFQRVMGLDYLTTQSYLKPWYAVFFVSACCLAVGVFLAIGDFLSLGRLGAGRTALDRQKERTNPPE
jgi:nitric oxide reductase large subunit